MTRRPLPGGLAEQRDGIKIQLGQGRDPVAVWTRKEGVGSRRIRALRCCKSSQARQSTAHQSAVSGTPGLSVKSSMAAGLSSSEKHRFGH